MNRADEAPAALGERLAADMAAAWARGERLPAEHYLARCPGLLDPPEGAVRLVYEEACLRMEQGEGVTAEELALRFPAWANELSAMLDCHRLVQERLAPPQFPAVGESLGDFRLLGELGRGGHGRVFLAAQPALADRLVVLKVTPRQDREFLTLARLQHTHVVPLYAVHDFPARNLRVLCQPYFGGATLARLLELLADTPPAARTGRSLLGALDRACGEPAGAGGVRSALSRAGYAEAVCWVGACLAGALHHAHQRGLVHLDIKPSNVLLAGDGRPMLLDFHLALHPVAAGGAASEDIGGTPAFMSPEQAAAYAAARRGAPAPAAVDGRSDVYSLGRLLAVALGGAGGRPLRQCNPAVSVGLADVVGRCLAPDPQDRYPDAAALADDLRRHLAGLPLRGVPNRSTPERWRKWRRRHPGALVRAAAVVALLAGAAATAAAALERVAGAREALREGRAQVRQGAYAGAARTLGRARARVGGWPGCANLVAQIDDELRAARDGAAAAQLHAVAEHLRLLAGHDALAPAALGALEARCRAAWQARHAAAGREQGRADLTDLAVLWVGLKGRQSSGAASRREALAVLAEAEALCGPDAALAQARQSLGGPAVRREAQSFHEHLALARARLLAGELTRAAAELERAAELRPQDFWAHFYQGVCAHRRGRYADAAAAFGTAAALAPACAPVYHNRALARAAAGDTEAALRDYDRALGLDPTLAAAALNRGVLHYQQGRYAQALDDMRRALGHGGDPAAAHYNLALVHLARGDQAAAGREAAAALRAAPGHARARRLADSLRGR